MNCNEARASLTALLDSELTEEASTTLQTHLAECADCAAVYAELKALSGQVDAWDISGGDVWESVREEIETADFGMVMQELQALRNEVRTLRAEIAGLHRQMAATPSLPTARPGVLLFPYSASEDSPLSIV